MEYPILSYLVKYNPQKHRVEVVHRGKLTTDSLAESVPQVRKTCSENQCWVIVSDVCDTDYSISDTDEFAVAEQLAEAFPENTRLIIIHKESQIPLERIRLLEQTTQLHGLYLTFTSDVDEVEILLVEHLDEPSQSSSSHNDRFNRSQNKPLK